MAILCPLQQNIADSRFNERFQAYVVVELVQYRRFGGPCCIRFFITAIITVENSQYDELCEVCLPS